MPQPSYVGKNHFLGYKLHVKLHYCRAAVRGSAGKINPKVQ